MIDRFHGNGVCHDLIRKPTMGEGVEGLAERGKNSSALLIGV